VDKDEEFNKTEIEAALVGLLRESPKELEYVTKNVFRYDRDNNNVVTYDELVNFDLFRQTLPLSSTLDKWPSSDSIEKVSIQEELRES